MAATNNARRGGKGDAARLTIIRFPKQKGNAFWRRWRRFPMIFAREKKTPGMYEWRHGGQKCQKRDLLQTGILADRRVQRYSECQTHRRKRCGGYDLPPPYALHVNRRKSRSASAPTSRLSQPAGDIARHPAYSGVDIADSDRDDANSADSDAAGPHMGHPPTGTNGATRRPIETATRNESVNTIAIGESDPDPKFRG